MYNFIPNNSIVPMANINRTALDKQRSFTNLPPITDEEFSALEKAGMTPEELAEHENANPKPNTKPEEKPTPELVEKVREMTDEELMAAVGQRTGRTLKGWDELKPTAEQVNEQQANEDREAAKITWGLQNKKFKPKDYEGYVADSKNPTDLVFNYRLQEARKDDPTLDEKEFRDEFNEEFGLDQKPETRRYKSGQNTLQKLASSILTGTYGSIINLDRDYTGYENQQKIETQRREKIKAEAPVYKASVEKVFSGLKKIKAKLGDNEEYEVDSPAEIEPILAEIKESMLSADYASSQILNGYTEADLNDLAFTALLRKGFPVLANEFAKQHLKKHAAGTIGIPKIKAGEGEINDQNLTENQKKLRQIITDNKVPAEAN